MEEVHRAGWKKSPRYAAMNLAVGAAFIADGTSFNVINGANPATALTVPTITDDSFVLSFTGADVNGDLVLTAHRTNSYEKVVSGGNNQSAAAALERAGRTNPNGDMKTVLDTLDQMTSASEINNAISTMIPDMSSGSLDASRDATNQFTNSISNRIGGLRVGQSSGVATGDILEGMGFWVQGLGNNTHQGSRKGISGFNSNLFGTAIGADRVVDDHVRVGAAGGYTFANVNSKQPGSPSDTINSWQGAIYGSYDSINLRKARQSGKKSKTAVRNQIEDNWYVDGMVGFTQNNYDSRREIWLTPANKRVAKADHYGQQYTTSFESGYTFVFEETKNLELTPFAGLAYSYLRMNRYKESGANALNLTVEGEGYNQLLQSLGTKFAYPLETKKAGTFIPSAKAAWLYDYIGERFQTTASFAGGGGDFISRGAKPAKSGLLLGGEVAFLNKGNMTLTGNYDLVLKEAYASNTYYATVRFDF